MARETCAAPKYTDRTVTCGNVTTMRKCRHYTPYLSSPPASNSKSDCICDVGAFPWTHDGTCIQCARGMHKPSQGPGECVLCPAGTYAPEVGARICTECPQNSNSSTGSVSINNCLCLLNIQGCNAPLNPRCFLVKDTELYYNLLNTNNNGGDESCERFVPNDRSQCLDCVLPIMRCACGTHRDVGLAERRTPCRFVGNLTSPSLFLGQDGRI